MRWTRIPLVSLTLIGMTWAIAGGGCAEPVQPDAPASPGRSEAPASLAAVAEHPERFVAKTVQLVGKLENQGANYFTDLRLVLRDDQGHAIPVRPSMPLEVPPGPSTEGRQPNTLASRLGKIVEVTAVVKFGELGKRGEVHYLEVQDLAVIADRKEH